jgi:hypothetical protein
MLRIDSVAPTLGTVMAMMWPIAVGDGSGTTMATVRWGWRRHDIEAKGGVDDHGVASREATEALREVVSREAAA